MKTRGPALIERLRRCSTLRCPACGNASIMQRPFKIAERCSSCRVIFNREQGFFVGAILVNVVSTEAVILLTYMISISLFSLQWQYIVPVLLTIGILFPIVFFHHSWSIWLTFDHLVEGLPRA
jgi:uncharacterized protein (DUF983 family)